MLQSIAYDQMEEKKTDFYFSLSPVENLECSKKSGGGFVKAISFLA